MLVFQEGIFFQRFLSFASAKHLAVLCAKDVYKLESSFKDSWDTQILQMDAKYP